MPELLRLDRGESLMAGRSAHRGRGDEQPSAFAPTWHDLLHQEQGWWTLSTLTWVPEVWADMLVGRTVSSAAQHESPAYQDQFVK